MNRIKILAVALAALLMLPLFGRADVTVEARASHSMLYPGDSFSIDVKFIGAGDKLAGVQFIPVISSGVTVQDISNNKSWVMRGNVVAFTDQANAVDDITFTLYCSTEPDVRGTITVSFDSIKWSAGDSITASVVLPPLAIKVLSSLSGDANDDGEIDIMDLVAIIDYIVYTTSVASPVNADANGNGTIDIMDLVWIIDYIVGS